MPIRKNTRNRGTIAKYKTPQLNPDEYHLLFDLLLESVFQANFAAMARVLGLSRTTVMRMDKRPPAKGKQWWWILVLREVLKAYYKEMSQSAHNKHRVQAEAIRKKLKRHDEELLLEDLQIQDLNAAGASRFLLALLADSHSGMIEVKELKKIGVRGSYSMRSMRRAAERLELVKEFREDEWFWRLPTLDDL